MESDPLALQYPFPTWITELPALALKEQVDLVVSDSCVGRSVHSVSSPDPEDEQKRARLDELHQRALVGKIDLYYEDEVDLALPPGVMRC